MDNSAPFGGGSILNYKTREIKFAGYENAGMAYLIYRKSMSLIYCDYTHYMICVLGCRHGVRLSLFVGFSIIRNPYGLYLVIYPKWGKINLFIDARGITRHVIWVV